MAAKNDLMAPVPHADGYCFSVGRKVFSIPKQCVSNLVDDEDEDTVQFTYSEQRNGGIKEEFARCAESNGNSYKGALPKPPPATIKVVTLHAVGPKRAKDFPEKKVKAARGRGFTYLGATNGVDHNTVGDEAPRPAHDLKARKLRVEKAFRVREYGMG